MSLFSKIFKGARKLVRGAAKAIIPAAISTIPVIGPIAASVIGGTGILGGLGGGSISGRGEPAVRTMPGVGAAQVGPPVSRRGRRASAAPVFRGGAVTGTRTRFEQRPGTTTQPQKVQQMSIFSAIPGIIRAGTQAAARISATPAGRAVVVGTTAAAAADVLFDQFGNPVTRKRRRMNFGNGKAARRAIRRIKGTRKLLQDIEKQLPRRAAPRRRRDLGPEHTHVR